MGWKSALKKCWAWKKCTQKVMEKNGTEKVQWKSALGQNKAWKNA